MTETDYQAMTAAARPVVTAVLTAQTRGDRPGVCAAIRELYKLPPAVAFAAVLRLGEIAALHQPANGDGTEPAGPETARGFALRFTAASAARDLTLQRLLWLTLLQPACGPDAQPEAECVVHEATHLLVRAAAEGLAREAQVQRRREQRKHQHPNARRGQRARRGN